MECPRCNEIFFLTWGRYLKAPMGGLTCPACGAGMELRHKWFYGPLLVAGCCVTGAPMAMLAYYYFGEPGRIPGWLLGAVIAGFPIDKHLENKFGVLKADKKTAHDEKAEKPTTGAIDE